MPGPTHSGCPLWAGHTIRPMGLEWEQTIVDAADPASLGSWWREALGWVIVNDDPVVFEIQPNPDRLPAILFWPSTTPSRGRTVSRSTCVPTIRAPRWSV